MHNVDSDGPPRQVEGRTPLSILFLLHAAAMAAYLVPFPNVLDAHGLGSYAAWALGTGSIASLISPMIVGALADRRVAPERLLAALTFMAGTLLILVHVAVEFGWGPHWFMSLMMGYALCNAPGFALVTSIVLARLNDARREFGPIRVWATWGWMLASFGVGWLLPRQSPWAGYTGGAIFLAECVFCLLLTPSPPPASRAPRRWRDYFGWDALALLRHPDHRLIFLTSTLLSALLSAFYLYTVRHLEARGDPRPALTMSLAQVFEGLAMFGLGAMLLRFRIKWLLTAGLVLAVVRHVLLMVDDWWAVVTSLALHGPLYVIFYMTCQIYLEQRIDSRLRVQSQALLSLLNNGIGNILGFSSILAWYNACQSASGTDWPKFWSQPAAGTAVLCLMFLLCYRGQKRESRGDSLTASTPE